MKRLVDHVETAGGMERLTELVSAKEPFRPNPFTKRRVLLRLQAMRGGPKPLLKPWAAAAGLMFIVGSAVAGTGWWRGRSGIANDGMAVPRPSMPSPPAAPSPPVATEPSPASPEAMAPDIAAGANDNPAPKAHAAKRRSGVAADDTAAARRSGVTVDDTAAARRSGVTVDDTAAAHVAGSGGDDSTPLRPTAGGGEDPTPVARAIRALRSERNPAQAELLLQEYLRLQPHGALAEDALALLIETASALRSTSAADRATRYLELYPNGRYRATARRVLASRP